MKPIIIAVIAATIATGLVGILGSKLVQPASAQQCASSASSSTGGAGSTSVATQDACATTGVGSPEPVACAIAVLLGQPLAQCA